MLVDVRNRSSYSPVKIPCKYQAYLFRFSSVDFFEYRVIIAESAIKACQYMKDWCLRESVDLFYTYEGEINYEIAGVAGDDYYRELLFNDNSHVP